MKQTLIIIIVLAALSVQGQPVTVTSMNAAIKAAITAQAKIQATTDATQNAVITALTNRVAIVEKGDTLFFDKKYFTTVGKTVYLNMDSVAKNIKVPSVDLTAINTSIASLNNSITSLGVRITSLDQWRTVAQGSLDNINTTISLLPPIPTKAVSVSTSTTTTTTTTTLQ